MGSACGTMENPQLEATPAILTQKIKPNKMSYANPEKDENNNEVQFFIERNITENNLISQYSQVENTNSPLHPHSPRKKGEQHSGDRLKQPTHESVSRQNSQHQQQGFNDHLPRKSLGRQSVQLQQIGSGGGVYFHAQDTNILPSKMKRYKKKPSQMVELGHIANLTNNNPNTNITTTNNYETSSPLLMRRPTSLKLNLDIVKQMQASENMERGSKDIFDPDFQMLTSRDPLRTLDSMRHLEEDMLEYQRKLKQKEGQKTRRELLMNLDGRHVHSYDEQAEQPQGGDYDFYMMNDDFFVKGKKILQIDKNPRAKKLNEKKQQKELFDTILENNVRPTDLIIGSQQDFVKKVYEDQGEGQNNGNEEDQNMLNTINAIRKVKIKAFEGYQDLFEKDIKTTINRLANSKAGLQN